MATRSPPFATGGLRYALLTLAVAVALYSEFVVKGNASNIQSDSDQGFTTDAIGCFMCTTFNGSNDGCTDPFHPRYTPFEEKCYQGKRDRLGRFPAKYCLKIHGTRLSDQVDIFIRTCATADMGNFCGDFDFDGDLYNGCIRTCQTYACNHGNSLATKSWISLSVVAIVTSLMVLHIL